MHYCEYRPEGAWNAEEFVINTVKRDDKWFEDKFPIMEEFYKEWMINKAAGVVLPEITRSKRLQISWEETLAHINVGEYTFIDHTPPRLDVVTHPTGAEDEFCDCPKLDLHSTFPHQIFEDHLLEEEGQFFGGAMTL